MSDYYSYTKRPIDAKIYLKEITLEKEYNSLKELVMRESIDYVVLKWEWSSKTSVDIDCYGDRGLRMIGFKSAMDPEYSYAGKVDEKFYKWADSYSCSDSYVFSGQICIYELPTGKKLLVNTVIEYSDDCDDNPGGKNLVNIDSTGIVVWIEGENYLVD